MIRKHMRRAAKASFAISIGVAIVLGLVACGSSKSSKSSDSTTAAAAPSTSSKTIVLGTKNFPEEYILGQLYKQALEHNGFKVSYKENIGSTELIHTALTNGKLNMYPEYTGVIVQEVYHHALSAKTAGGTYALAKQLEEKNGLTLLDATPFFDTDAVAVLKTTAAKYHLSAIADLKKVPGLKLAALPEFKTRNTGLVGLRRSYGLKNVTFIPLAGISPYQALDTKKAQAAAVFSTDPPLGKGSKYLVLKDPAHVFGFQNVAPIVKASLKDALGSKFDSTINDVSAKLSQDAIVAMNKAVIVDKQPAAKVAKAFLKANGLL